MDEPPSFQIAEYFSGGNLIYILVTVLLLFLAAVISMSESAFFSLQPEEVESIRRRNPKKGKQVSDLISHPKLLLSVLTFWKYLMLIASAIIFTIAIQIGGTARLIEELILLASAFAIFAVIIPKIVGSFRRANIVLKLSAIYYKLVTLTKPFVQPFIKVSTKVERKLEAMADEASVRELTHALELAVASNETTDEDKQMLKGIVNFGTLTVAEVMRPENEIHAVDTSLNFHDLLLYIRRSGFSRLPAYRESYDDIQGVLYIKDLLPYLKETKKFNWQKLLRPAYFVSETKKIDLLLRDFQEKRVHIALAVGNDGKVSGLITLEDIIEEIIGDIHDEFDEAGAYYKKLDDKTFVFDSKISLNDFCRILDVEPEIFDVEKSENETLGGVLNDLQPELPKIGDQITVDPVTFVIEAVDHKRIKKIRVFLNEQKES